MEEIFDIAARYLRAPDTEKPRIDEELDNAVASLLGVSPPTKKSGTKVAGKETEEAPLSHRIPVSVQGRKSFHVFLP